MNFKNDCIFNFLKVYITNYMNRHPTGSFARLILNYGVIYF